MELYEDDTFDLYDRENNVLNGGYGRISRGYTFINNGIEATDVNQGRVGDCWFLSALISCAAYDRRHVLENVLNRNYNETNGPTRGKLKFKFYKYNQFVTVTIDDRIPRAQADMAAATGDWWVPLCEKAYAKFVGSYTKIDGGFPRISFFHLSGGITVDMYIKDVLNPQSRRSVRYWFRMMVELFQTKNVLINAGNMGDSDGNREIENGIQPYHAYSITDVRYVKRNTGEKVRVLRIHNPHGYGAFEWTGPWSDNDYANWSTIADGHVLNKRRPEGGFWMEVSDFFSIFEMASFCRLPQTWDDRRHLIDVEGYFYDKKNCPADGRLITDALEAGKNIQFLLSIDAIDIELWVQLVLDMEEIEDFQTRQISLNIYTGIPAQLLNYKPYGEDVLQSLHLVEPMLPWMASERKNLNRETYKINGHLYGMLSGGKYLIVLSCAETYEDCSSRVQFKLRLVGPSLSITQLNAPYVTIHPPDKEYIPASAAPAATELPAYNRRKKTKISSLFCC